MNVKRIWTLIKTEVFHGPKDVILVMAIIMPVLLALFINLAFGNIFTDRASLGIYDEGQSRLTTVLDSTTGIAVKEYENEADLKEATARGAVDMGIVLPANFESTLTAGTVKLKAYVWGESLAKNRILIPIAIADAVRVIDGADLPVNIQTIALGDESNLPWSDRLLPLVALIAVFYGGMMIPASSLINEKNRHTLEALSVSPTTIGDIFMAKGVIGAVLATVMGILAMAISGGFGSAFWPLVLVLALGAVLAAELGILAGTFVKDINSLFALWKFGGLLLVGPAIVFMFPQVPSWIGYIFPTFYFVKPVFDLSVNGLGLGATVPYLAILGAIILVVALVVRTIARRLGTQALRVGG